MCENENTAYLWNTLKAILRRKCIALNAYIKNLERFLMNDLMIHLQVAGKQKVTIKKEFFPQKNE